MGSVSLMSPFTTLISPLTKFAAEFVVFRRNDVLTFSRGNAQTRTILARLQRASYSSSAVAARIAPRETIGILEHVAKDFRQVREPAGDGNVAGKCRISVEDMSSHELECIFYELEVDFVTSCN